MENTVSASLAEPIFATTPTPRDVAAWTPSVEPLRYFLGGRDLGAIQIPALTLNVPFTHLSTNLEDSAPPWETLPPGIEAAVVPAQPVEEDLPRLALWQGMIRHTDSPASRFFVELKGTFPEYLQKFNAKQRYNLAREARKFAEFCGGSLDCRTFLSPDEMKDFCRHASRISANSWRQEIDGPGFSGTVPESEALALAKTGLARGYVLFHDQQPVAYVFCQANCEHLTYKHIGYHREYAKWSPGTVLLYLILERLFAEQEYELLDLGDGTLGYKSFFSNRCTHCVRVIYFRRTFQNLAIASSHLALSASSIAAGKLLARIGMKQRLKRRMMGKMRRPGQ